MFKRIIFLTFTLFISACGNVPITSGINEGPELGIDGKDSIIRVIASRPQPGMSQEQIVNGFLNASASSDNDFAIARDYLVPDKKDNWNPSTSIEVYEGQAQIQVVKEGEVSFTAALNSTIDEESRINISEPDEQLQKNFTLIRVNDEWRIDLDFDGLIISKTDLNRSFSIYPIWFVDPTSSYLVPENVILPKSVSANATRLMQLLLNGPSKNFNSSVVTGFPEGSALGIDSVPISNGVATVTLNEAVLKAENKNREILSAQIVKTLTRIPGVSSIQIKVGTQNLNVPNSSLIQNASTWEKYYSDAFRENNPYLISNQKVYQLVDDKFVDIPRSEINLLNWSFGTSNRQENLYALVNPEKTQLNVFDYRNNSLKKYAYQIGLFKNPVIDVFDYIWFISDGQIQVQKDGKILNVDLAKFDEVNVIEVIPAPDGVRILLIVRTVYGTELRIGNVIRKDQVITITNIRKVIRDGFSVSEASWADEANILYIDKAQEITSIFSLDSFTAISNKLYEISGAIDVSASSKQRVLIEKNDGTILERVAGDWKLIPNSSSINFPN